jgi:ABC-type molybdenum transport system ATPase subunit/photorepair protein PhrA
VHSDAPTEELVLLRDLNLQVRQKARIAVVGPNGSGKTTLLRTIAGVLPPLAGLVLGANAKRLYGQEQENLDQLDATIAVAGAALRTGVTHSCPLPVQQRRCLSQVEAVV